eukprot:CAMPEP_0184665376 /NCGR_PEP_ID=MMETSP0308-20130426/56966_1 /TAXON_ID=38269 /ORGANISM="Gloeochaete witrockiana, Strain SAG 46.84" /LENGTH=496 /DNA_ID=CAMNT_0027109339 /DNA_START=185 /DNA_END=1672 /DNA_ORIENTATION=-
MAEENEPNTPVFLKHFFNGPVINAIALAKQTNKLLLVSVEGDNDESNRIDQETWTHKGVCAILENDIVPLRLVENSEDARNFCVIYMVFKLPTIYMIAPNGTPVEVLVGFVDADSLMAKIQAAVSKVSSMSSPTSHTTDTSSVPQTTSTTTTSGDHPPHSASSGGLSAEEKQIRLQETIARAKAKREQEERELEKERERQRRESGKALVDAAKIKEEQEMKKAMAQREKEKLEERKEKERLRKLLEDDKRQRAEAGGKIPSMQEGKAPVVITPPKQIAIPPKQVEQNKAMVLFRLTNGETLKHEFPATATLREAKAYVDQHRTDGSHKYSMMTTFPRVIFNDTHLNQTMRALQLVPSGTIILTPADGSRPAPPPPALPSASDQSTPTPPPPSQSSGGGFLSTVASYLNPLSYFGSSSSSSSSSSSAAESASSAGHTSSTSSTTSSTHPSQPRAFGARTMQFSDLSSSQSGQDEKNANDPTAGKPGKGGWQYGPNPQ